MKKNLSLFLACSLLLVGRPAFAGETFPQLTMQAAKADVEYNWQEGTKLVAVRTDTGAAIPLSEYEYGYFYALVPEGTGLRFESRETPVFSDIEPFMAPYGLDYLALREVFIGDENGAFRGAEPLSRAQMAALLARILGAQGAEATPFADVPADSWFSKPISALLSRGILAKDMLFDPHREVSREELVTMAARLVEYLGMLPEEVVADAEGLLVDFKAISPYAQEAYLRLYGAGYRLPVEYIEHENPLDLTEREMKADPAACVTRTEAAEFLAGLVRDLLRNARPAIPNQIALDLEVEVQMPRIDGSTSSYPLTSMIYQQLFLNAQNHPQFPKAHTKTITSYQRLIGGETDVIFVPDPNEEVKSLAQGKGVQLQYIPIANEALVFFTGEENPAAALTSQQIQDIYLNNAVSDWSQLGAPAAPFAAFCRNNDSGSHAQMERFFLNGAEINADIRRERTSIAMSNIITDLLHYEQEHPGSFALGYSMYYYIENTKATMGEYPIRLLAVDGVTPDVETIGNGSYPLSTHYFAVLRSDEPEDSPARRLVQWLTEPAGQELVKAAGFGPLGE